MERMLLASTCIAILYIGIIFSVLFESIQFFRKVPYLICFWFRESINCYQRGSSGFIWKFSAVPLFIGTILISLVAMVIAVPIGLMSAIYLAEYANTSVSICRSQHLKFLRHSHRGIRLCCNYSGPVLRDFGDR